MRSVLITGCSSGVGAALAERCAKDGWATYGTVRKDADVAELEARGANAVICDVSDAAAVDAAVARIVEETGRIDAVVANAGVGYVRNVEQAPEAEIANLFDINVHGVVRCIRAVLPHMRKAGHGHVVAVSSVGGLVGQPFNELYCATKFAVEGLIEGLASYVTPGFGVDFTSVEPGGIRSEFANTVLQKVGASGGILEDDYKPLIDAYLGGMGARGDGIYQTSEEVADVIANVLGTDSPPLRLRTSEWSEHFTRFKTEADPTGIKQRDESIRVMLGESYVP